MYLVDCDIKSDINLEEWTQLVADLNQREDVHIGVLVVEHYVRLN